MFRLEWRAESRVTALVAGNVWLPAFLSFLILCVGRRGTGPPLLGSESSIRV